MQNHNLTQRELRRYGKQIMLPEIGIKGQTKIRNSSVLVIGAGGLGCPVLQYLAAAGIGRLGIVEFDTVAETNLQRQVLYGTLDVGKLKSIIVRDRLEHLNNHVNLEIKNLKLDGSNARAIFEDYDVIVDATDNYEARYVISDTCASLGKPMVHGSIYKYEGAVSVFNYRGGPSYRSFNPGNQGKEKDPKPSEAGLFGVVPGITGTLMANEVIKIITGIGEVLSGKVLLFNSNLNSFRYITIKSDPRNEDSH
ncbi:MAG: HesA/MoeB/ThiF family protein [Bacteroidales bacterium]